jgi:inward rectifier potassium channel
VRFLSPDGRNNLVLYGVRRHFYTDVYHSWLRAPWRLALAAVTVLYLAVNCLFAAAYLLVGGVENLGPRSYSDAFFFSVQTIATIGYGHMVPISMAANLLVTLESLVGLIGVAMATGLMFAKFARPTARVLWSDVVVVAPFEGVPSLMFRVANQRGNQVVEAQIRVTLLISENTREGFPLRRNIDLRLVRSQSTVFALSWTVIHPLTADSPLVTHTRDQLQSGRAEIVASLTGLDDAFNQTIHSRHVWAMDEIAWNARFVDILGTLPDGRQGVDYRRFHDFVPLDAQAAPPPPLTTTPGLGNFRP